MAMLRHSKLTAQIVISHTSMSELTPKELVDEIKSIYNIFIHA